jgi:hypothetical protein
VGNVFKGNFFKEAELGERYFGKILIVFRLLSDSMYILLFFVIDG